MHHILVYNVSDIAYILAT